jgi:hypothetical protein
MEYVAVVFFNCMKIGTHTVYSIQQETTVLEV